MDFRPAIGCQLVSDGQGGYAEARTIASPSPPSFFFRIALLFSYLRAIDVMTARERTERKAIMKTFTIDENNNITVSGSKEEAAGASGLAFSSQKELAKLTAEWPVGRFVEIWNGFAGVAPFGELKPVKKFTDRKVAVARIWQAIQRLRADGAADSVTEPAGEMPLGVATEIELVAPEATPEGASIPEVIETAEVATVLPPLPDVAPEVAAATTEASTAENVHAEVVAEPASMQQTATKQPKRKKATKPAQNSAAPRETKLSQVVAMLQRPEGATISEIMQKMGWLKHTVRGFMAGTMKKAGYSVESFKPEGGERSYRINPK
jgi:Protein of unknown function (DUF3489)